MWNDDQYYAPQQWLKDSDIGTEIAEDTKDTQKRYTRTNELAIRAYWRTLLMDCAAYPVTRLTSDEIVAGDAAFRSILLYRSNEHNEDYSKANEASTDEHQDLDDSLVTKNLLRRWDQLSESMRCMWTRNYKCWSFAVTENGLYTMIQHAMTGDLIASVQGAKVPLVLRPKGEFQGKKTYELVGAAYVHGFMDGEAFKATAGIGLTEKEILLQ
ncbi:putative heterokaryon incompatibility protein [Diaporthe ampelina]|uniref:Putative heterokaryon incompatibility protein n=1 Tax=Diaporthe ampelina TaxID=1214573 RepID=A0A0G2HT66_9PEZI|nr:putative heterokaryon incompatibility protein [Diaporthe ampelina]